jgi:1,4-dihydroxy-2-naphthoyl-CoA hydrolase
MSIWKMTPPLEQMNSMQSNTIHGPLGILFTEIGEDYMEATMPVDARTHQPMGLLHGGASVVLAESLGSIASLMVNGPGEGVGIEINASHLKGVRSGKVVGRVTPIRLGKSVHVWEIRIRENQDLKSDLVCICRLTVKVRQKA